MSKEHKTITIQERCPLCNSVVAESKAILVTDFLNSISIAGDQFSLLGRAIIDDTKIKEVNDDNT